MFYYFPFTFEVRVKLLLPMAIRNVIIIIIQDRYKNDNSLKRKTDIRMILSHAIIHNNQYNRQYLFISLKYSNILRKCKLKYIKLY